MVDVKIIEEKNYQKIKEKIRKTNDYFLKFELKKILDYPIK